MFYRRYVRNYPVSSGNWSQEDMDRRSYYNLTVLIEVWDSLIELAQNPVGIWADVIAAHVKEALPK